MFPAKFKGSIKKKLIFRAYKEQNVSRVDVVSCVADASLDRLLLLLLLGLLLRWSSLKLLLNSTEACCQLIKDANAKQELRPSQRAAHRRLAEVTEHRGLFLYSSARLSGGQAAAALSRGPGAV